MYTLIDEDHKDRAELNIFGVVNRIAKQHVGETEDYVSDSVGDAQLWESALRRNSQNFLRNNQIQKALKKLGHLCNNPVSGLRPKDSFLNPIRKKEGELLQVDRLGRKQTQIKKLAKRNTIMAAQKRSKSIFVNKGKQKEEAKAPPP